MARRVQAATGEHTASTLVGTAEPLYRGSYNVDLACFLRYNVDPITWTLLASYALECGVGAVLSNYKNITQALKHIISVLTSYPCSRLTVAYLFALGASLINTIV